MAGRPRFEKEKSMSGFAESARRREAVLVPGWMRLEKRHLIAKRAQVRGNRGVAFGRKERRLNGAASSR